MSLPLLTSILLATTPWMARKGWRRTSTCPAWSRSWLLLSPRLTTYPRMWSMPSLSSRWPSLTNSAISRPTWSDGYYTSCSPIPSCTHPSTVASSMWCHSPRESSTAASSGCSLAVKPPNGRWWWPKFAQPASPPRLIALRATNSSYKMPSVQRSWCNVVGRAAPRVPWCGAAWRSRMSARSANCCPNCSMPTCPRCSRLPTCRPATT